MMSKYSQCAFYMTHTYPFDSCILNSLWYEATHTFVLFMLQKVYIGKNKDYIYIGNLMTDENKDFAIIGLHLKDKTKSFILTGFYKKSRIKYYKDLKINCKFKLFIDRNWRSDYDI